MAVQEGTGAETLDREVRVVVFRRAADAARVPQADEIAAALGRPRPEVEASIRRLADGRVWVLAPGTANIWAANPFCAVPSNFRVRALGRTYWAVCIWDALGIPAALHADATVTARCGDCDEELVLVVRNGALVRDEGVVHFAVPASRWWDNIAFACSTMLLFRSEEHVDRWCAFRELPRGGAMSPEQCWQLAQGWYTDKVSSDWRRKTLEEAEALLAEVGLTGPFWSLRG